MSSIAVILRFPDGVPLAPQPGWQPRKRPANVLQFVPRAAGPFTPPPGPHAA
ncbi:MAG: hypothetical protein ACYDCQ_05120 [Dehalococcoidia bacterium]